MKRITIEDRIITNLYSFLKKTDADEIIVQTSRVRGGWYDNESDAMRAGFHIRRYINPEYEARHLFAECYQIRRK